MEHETASSHQEWQVLGVKVPKNEVVYLTQILGLYTIIITSIVNLSIHQEHREVWIGLLSSCLGFLLPNPSLKKSRVVLNNV